MFKNLSIAAFCMLVLTSTATAQTDFREALRIAFPATVSVQVDNGDEQADGRILRRQWGRFGGFEVLQGLSTGSGRTGFAVGSNLIATQLASDIDEVTVKISADKQLNGKVVSRDYVTGLTLIKVEGTEFVSLVVGAGVPEAGQPVVITRLAPSGAASGELGMIASGPTTIDSQLGFTQHVSANMDLSDAGAPLVDATGVVVGIVGAGANGDLLCLPTEPLQRLIDAAAGNSPNSKRGMVGIQFAGGGDPVIMSVSEGSPAATAGIQTGDRVVRVSEYDVSSSEHILAAVAMARAGDSVPIVVTRGDETMELVVTLQEHPRQEFAQSGAVGQFGRQAWQLNDGKLVPLENGGPPAQAPQFLEKDLESFFENLPNNRLILPGLPKRLEGFEVERSELEDSLRNQEGEIKSLKKKLKELQDKLQDS